MQGNLTSSCYKSGECKKEIRMGNEKNNNERCFKIVWHCGVKLDSVIVVLN